MDAAIKLFCGAFDFLEAVENAVIRYAEPLKTDFNVEPITIFSSLTTCPQCGWMDTHYFEYVTNSYVTRKCNQENCNRKWKQER